MMKPLQRLMALSEDTIERSSGLNYQRLSYCRGSAVFGDQGGRLSADVETTQPKGASTGFLVALVTRGITRKSSLKSSNTSRICKSRVQLPYLGDPSEAPADRDCSPADRLGHKRIEAR